MKLDRLPYEPSALLAFYERSFTRLGALCERTWHDRLCVVAEGEVGRIWENPPELVETELQFVAPDAQTPRDAAREVFPGCPLTFRLAEALTPRPPLLERAAVRFEDKPSAPPAADQAARLWTARFPRQTAWQPETPFQPACHASLLAVVRCEIQAIDQHWSLHRIVLNLGTRERDPGLETALEFATVDPSGAVAWPALDFRTALNDLRPILQAELGEDLSRIRQRQEQYLARELGRIEDYFAAYEAELEKRQARARSESSVGQIAQRKAAANDERAHRREDQIQRHTVHVLSHWDAFLHLLEPAWEVTASVVENHQRRAVRGRYVPRLRQWMAAAV